MIDMTYITSVSQNEVNVSLLQPKHHVTSYHGKMNLINLGSWSNYKKMPTYKKNKENKENVGNHNNRDIKANITYRNSLHQTAHLHL
jgi:hypothetical protein